ncbi:MAG: serine hydrolase, partial [Paludibacteraceae bacterium]|nr:serine hydrolase [Paludibacteraceae bacterium]
MKRLIAIFAVLSMTLAAVARELPRALPDGPLSQSSILAFYDSLMTAPGTQLHGVMILQHGRVVGEMYPEPFGPAYRHTMYSCSKTLVGIGVMLAHEEGLLALDAPILPVLRSALDSILPPEVPEGVECVHVCDLLEMSSGWTADWGLRSRSLHWLSDYLSRPLDFEPGSRFEYDSMVSYLLSAVVQAAVGRPLLDYLNEKLFVPLGIEAAWEQSPEGVSCGGWGLYLHLESMAKIGQLLLQKGSYGGRRILSAQSVDALSACRRTDTWGDCYGGQVWGFKLHPGAYRADGAYGQFIIVVPEYDLVVALTQCTTGDLARQLESIWQVLLHPGKDDKPLSAKAW